MCTGLDKLGSNLMICGAKDEDNMITYVTFPYCEENVQKLNFFQFTVIRTKASILSIYNIKLCTSFVCYAI